MERLPFFSAAWAEAVQEAINRGPSPEARAVKLQSYWEWVEQAGATFDGSLSVKVTQAPAESGLEGSCLLLALAGGRCTAARITTERDAADATFRLTARYADWQALLAGFDMGKAVMYRKIRLEGGDVLQFFHRIFYFIETLACAAQVPTRLPEETAAD